VNVDNTVVRFGDAETSPVVWSAENLVPDLSGEEVPREVSAVVELRRNNFRDGRLEWGNVKETLRAVPHDDSNDALPSGFLDYFFDRGLEFVVELLNSPNFCEWSTEFMEGQKEMTHQQLLMVPYTNLLMAASKNKVGYIADEQFTCPNFYKDFRDKNTGNVVKHVVAKLLAKPDSAILLTMRLALATSEFKKDVPSIEDMFKGVMFATTATHELAKNEHYDVFLPFAVSGGFKVNLYVSFVPSADSAPKIRRVREFDLKRKNDHFDLFFWLFALLGEANRRTSNAFIVSNVDTKAPNAIGDSSKNFSADRTAERKTSSNNKRKDSPEKGQSQTKRGSTLSEAMSAASLGGRVVDVSPAFPLNAVGSWNRRSHSHYFRGVFRESGKPVFIKVICGEADDEVRLQRLAREKTAGDCRVPEVVDHCKAEDCDVIVMEFVKIYAVDRGSVRAFAETLIGAIKFLHARGILHCDLKPDNAAWDGESVAIIDFGHAQLIDGAESYRGTHGFTAPEVAVDQEPHSTASDAFSVGKTLEHVVAETGAHDDKHLAAIIAGLTKADVAERLTLSDALEKLETSSPSSKRHRPAIPEVTP